MNDDHREQLGAYLLDALEPEEATELERHLERCERCRAEVGRLRAAVELLPRAADPMRPPARLKRELMGTVRRESRGRRLPLATRLGGGLRATHPRRLAAVAAAVAVAIAFAGGYALNRSAAPRAIQAKVDRARLPATAARLVVEPGGSGARLELSGLPRAAPGRVYEVWLQRGGDVLPAGVFDAAPGGSGTTAVGGELKGASAVMVTSERAPGSDQPTTPPLLRVPL